MKCKKCGCDTFIKKGDWYECAECGAQFFDTTVTVNDVDSPTKLVDSIESANKKSKVTLTGDGENSAGTQKASKKRKRRRGEQGDDPQGKPERSKLREAIEFLIPIVVAVVIAIILKNVVFANAVVPTGSMLNTISQGDRIIASRLAYKFEDPQRYDVVIFKFPDDETQYFVKRVIGLPGETVQIVDGTVYVTKTDGETIMLDDSFVTNCEPVGDYGPFEVPEDSYFMMGDNRNSSHDSRFWENKYVHKSKIVGKVKFRYYPDFSKIE